MHYFKNPNSILFRMAYSKRIGRMSGSYFYYKIKRNTLTVRMLRGRKINFLDIIRLLIKDDEFISAYMCNKYDIFEYKDIKARFVPIQKSEESAATTLLLLEYPNGQLRDILQMNSLYQLHERECKLHIPHILLFLCYYFSNYFYIEIDKENNKAWTVFKRSEFYNTSTSQYMSSRHFEYTNLMNTSTDIRANEMFFVERFLMGVRTDDKNDNHENPNTIELLPYRMLAVWVSQKEENAFKKMYNKYKKFLNKYTVVYVRNPLDHDLDIDKNVCYKILSHFEQQEWLKTSKYDLDENKSPIKEYSGIMFLSDFIKNNFIKKY